MVVLSSISLRAAVTHPPAVNNVVHAPEQDLARLIVQTSPRGALDVVLSCLSDNSHGWRLLFDQGLSTAIATDPALRRSLFERILGDVAYPYAAEVVEAFLCGLSAKNLAEVWDIDTLKDKKHAANVCFCGASFPTALGAYFLGIFLLFRKHGLEKPQLDIVASKCLRELERACSLRSVRFLNAVLPHLDPLPAKLVTGIVTRPNDAAAVIAMLVQECGVPMAEFSSEAVLRHASPEVRSFIVALEGRSRTRPTRAAPLCPVSRKRRETRAVSRDKISSDEIPGVHFWSPFPGSPDFPAGLPSC
jgi:hypothetical protein